MAHDKQKVIDIALAEVGYLEKASNSQLDSKTANAGNKNRTKYSRDLANASFYNGNKQGVAWCDVFVDWCFVQAYGKADALAMTYQPTNAKNNSGAGCKYSRIYYKAKGKLFDTPQIGDQIFFFSADKTQIAHTGLVYKVDSNKVYTVEGNTSGVSGVIANGGGVCKKSYNLTYGRIAGYGRPNYGEQPAVVTQPDTEKVQAFTVYTIKKGDTLWRIAQKHLGRGDRYKEIMQLNNMQKDMIYAGKQLKIPKG
jgi:LysM repeat protein